MITETHWLPEGQFLDKLEPFASKGLPTNSIIYKKVTGCGATTLEIEFPRNSIIIEPNLPVIKGKCKKINKGARKHKVILGVYEGINVTDIKYYIENKMGYKKILTTPEGFHKVYEAIGETIFQDYFLLFDECEKAIQDVDFRNNIIDPIDAFFLFDKKAFVSATPIMPSDPRFNEFDIVQIEPDYDFVLGIQVAITNNVVYQLKVLFDKYQETQSDGNRKYFIFFKSTSRIKNIIKGLELEDYAVYCSEKSEKELRSKLDKVYDSIGVEFAKYNFLTSRFFSAVDFDYDVYNCDPIIIMVSDVMAVEHSTIDPHTEAIQICGRFRKPEDNAIVVKKDVHHISNYNTTLTSYNETQINAILQDKKQVHEFIIKYKPKSDIDYFNKFIEEILELNGFNCFLKKGETKLNHFMVDNFVNTEKVKGYYGSSKSLIDQYKLTEHFSVSADSKYYHHILTDQELIKFNDQTSTEDVNEFVSQSVKNIVENVNPAWARFNFQMLRMLYPKQMAIIDSYGIKNAATLDYNIEKIQKEQNEAKGLSTLLPVIRYIQRSFEKRKYTSEEIESILTKGIKETGMSKLKPNVQLLRNAALLSERCNVAKDALGNWKKGYEIIDFIHNF